MAEAPFISDDPVAAPPPPAQAAPAAAPAAPVDTSGMRPLTVHGNGTAPAATFVSGDPVAPAPQQPQAPPDPQEQLRQFTQMLGGKDQDVDYRAGAPWNVRVAAARADNPDEVAAALERRVGKGNFGQDAAGRWWVKGPDGKKTAVRPEGLAGAFTNFGVDTAAASPVLAGAVGGAAGGTMIGGPIGGVLGAGVGAMGGKGLDEGEKALEGTHRKTAGQEIGTLAKEGMINSTMETVGPAARQAGRGISNWVRGFTGGTKDTQAMTRNLVDSGARPPLVSVAPSAKALQQDQKMRNLVMSDPQEKRNTQYVIERGRDVLRAEGMSPDKIDNIMGEVLDQDARMSGAEVGEGLKTATQQYLGGLQAEHAAADKEAAEALGRAEGQLRDYAAGQEGRLGEDVADAIVQARVEFGATMSKAYARVDQMAGNAKIVPITSYRNRANAIRLVTPPSELPPLIAQLADAPEDLKLTFQQAHELRSFLRSQARSTLTSLTPGVNAHNALNAAKEAGNALDELADLGDHMDMSAIANDNGLPSEALAALKKVDGWYAEGIAKFHNGVMNKLVKDAKDGIFPDPNVVAKTILAPGHTEQARTIIKLLPQNVRDQVARADAHNIIMKTVDPKTGLVDGMLLRSVLTDPSRMAVMREVYPPAILKHMTQLGDELAALGGKLDVREIRSFSAPDIEHALQTSIARSRDIDQFVKGNVMRGLANPDPDIVDRAADALISGGRGAHLSAVRDFLGEESPQWKSVQTYALKKVLREAVVETPTLAKSIEGKAIDDQMLKWTPEEQDMLFPNGLKEDLRMLSKDAKFLFPAEYSEAGTSIAAASIKSQIPFHVRADAKYVKYKLAGALADSPGFLRWLADAERQQPGMARRLAGPLSRALVNIEDRGPGQGEPTDVQQAPQEQQQ